MTALTLTPATIPETMRQLRLRSGLTQTALAKTLFVTSAALCYWERGIGRHGELSPRLDKLAEWANALGYEVEVTLRPKVVTPQPI